MGRGPTTKYHIDLSEGFVKGSMTCLTSETIKKKARPEFPLVLNIEPTNFCNLKCYMCAGQIRDIRRRGFMNFNLFRKIINECTKYKLHMLHLHKDGEPLMHPQIIDMIKYAKERKCADKIHLNTNGILLNNMAGKILDSGLDDITISIDACNPQTYRKIKCSDQYELTVNNTLYLIEQRNKRGLKKPFIRVKMMEFEDTDPIELENFNKFWTGAADQVKINGVHDWSGAVNVKVTDEVHKKPGRWPCVLLWYALAVNWDGRVSVCNLDWDLTGCIGKINKKHTIQSIWTDFKIRKVRQEAIWGTYNRLDICEKCIVWAGGDDMTEWFREHKEFL